MRATAALLLACLFLLAAGCGDSSPNRPAENNAPLAGGGRFNNSDPADGFSDSSGQTFPDIIPDEGLIPLYSAYTDCAENPRNLIIADSAAWKAWWDEVAGCQWRGMDDPMHPGDSSGPCGGRCATDPPPVDFTTHVVAAISVEYDSGAFCHRAVWVTGVEEEEGRTTIHYEVSRLDQSCCDMIMAMFVPMGFSPVVAVMIERPLAEPVRWVRADVVHSCPGPDPNEPMTLYYTDGSCDLGPEEQIITDSAAWAAWLGQAYDCELYRSPDTIKIPPDDSSLVDPLPFPLPPPVIGVDFTTHAVLILRAGQQAHWGGGIWLTALERAATGTIIRYSVMQPGDNCPAHGLDGWLLNPTVAIRIPLPLDPPVTFERQIEPIDCDWGNDSTWVDPHPGRDSL